MARGEIELTEASGSPAEPSGEVVPLPAAGGGSQPPPNTTLTRPGRLHGVAMVAMASFAIIGILATLAFITVGWPGDTGRRVIAVVVISIVGFMTSAAAAILAAARDTYSSGRSGPNRGTEP